MVPDTPESRAAFERGKERAELEARLNGHDREIRAESEARGRLEGKLEGVAKAVDQLADDFHDQRIREDTLTQQAQRAIARQVTRREFWFGVVTIVVSMSVAAMTVIATL